MGEFSEICLKIKEEVRLFRERIQQFQKKENLLSVHDLADGLMLDNDLEHVVKNISLLNSLKSQLLEIILLIEPSEELKKLTYSYYSVTALQSKYWREAEFFFTPAILVGQLKIQALNDTIFGLTKAAVGIGYEETIHEILIKNITTGGSYSTFVKLMLSSLKKNNHAETKSEITNLSILSVQIVSDCITQFNANYAQLMSSDLGYEWFKYANTLRTDSRPFCRAMCYQPYFHISEILKILKAKDLMFENENGEKEFVQLNEESGLPEGMFFSSSISMFFIYRGGMNCGHSIHPVSERQVPIEIKEKVFQEIEYKIWKKNNFPSLY